MCACLVSWKASRPSWPSSRPKPDCFMPPNGPASLSVSGSFTQTVPDLISRTQRSAVSRSRVYTFAPSPKRVPLASAIASSSESTGTIGATGPKVSSRSRSVSAGGAGDHGGGVVVASLHARRGRRRPRSVGAGRHRGLHLRLDLGALGRRHHRPDVGLVVERVAHAQRAGVLHEHVHEVVVQLARHVEALGRGAHLPGVQVGGPGAALGRHVHLVGHVGADDERVLAAHLEVHPRHALGARRGHALAGGHRAGEGHAVHARVAHDRLAHVARAGHHVERARRQVLEAGGEHQRGERRELRRLGHHRVARGERRRQLPARAAAAGSSRARCSPTRRSAPSARAPAGSTRSRGSRARRSCGPSRRSSRTPPRSSPPRRGSRAAACRPRASSPARSRRCAARRRVRHLVEQLGALHRRRGAPARRGLGRGRDRRVHLLRSGGVERRRASPRWPGSRPPAAARRPRPARRRSAVASPRAATLPAAHHDQGAACDRLLHRVRRSVKM